MYYELFYYVYYMDWNNGKIKVVHRIIKQVMRAPQKVSTLKKNLEIKI